MDNVTETNTGKPRSSVLTMKGKAQTMGHIHDVTVANTKPKTSVNRAKREGKTYMIHTYNTT
jgi:hypothetical protein